MRRRDDNSRMRARRQPNEAKDSAAPASPPQFPSRWDALVNRGRGIAGHPAASLALIAALAVAAYANSFSGDFVLDDEVWILANPSIRQLSPIGDVLSPANAGVVGGRPIVSLSLAINYASGGTNVWGYHAVNLAIHVLVAWTLFGVVRRTLLLPSLPPSFHGAAKPLALAVALVWAVHPLTTAAVTYIIQRSESLVALFYLLVLYCTIRGTADGRSPLWYLAAVVACLAGMATKEVMATAPLGVLLYDRAFLAGSFCEALKRRWGLYVVLAATWAILPWVLLSTGFHQRSTGLAVTAFTPWTYSLTEPGVIVHYLQLAVWPVGLCLDYQWPPATRLSQIVPAMIVVVVLLGATVWALVKRPKLGFLAATFFLILAPTSSFIPLKDAAFDHRMYLPLAVLATLVIIGGFAVIARRLAVAGPAHRYSGPRSNAPQAAAALLVVLIVVALATTTAERNRLYAAPIGLWQDVLKTNPNNARAHSNLAHLLSTSGRLAEAIEHGRRAVEIDPNFAEAESNLAGDLAQQGNLPEAIEHYQKSIVLNPNSAELRLNYAGGLLRQGNFDEAIVQCKKAIELKPDLAEGYNDMAVALVNKNKPSEAAEFARKAVKIDPNSPATHYNLAGILARTDDKAGAIVEVRETIRLNPTMANARFNLGDLLYGQGDRKSAIDEFRAAVKLAPNQPVFVNRLAWILATAPDTALRNGLEAIALAQRAVALTGQRDPAALDTLAAAEAEAGRFDTARRIAAQALALAAQQKNSALVEKIQARLRLYELQVPYHDRQ